jgi:NitT/TauT family transport system substrate-binding protein
VSGQIDAAGLVPPYDAMAAAEGMVRVADYRDILPNMTPQVFATTEALIAAHGPELSRFLDGYRASAQWVVANPAEAVRILQEDAQISQGEAQSSYDFARPDYSTDGTVDRAGLDNWLEFTRRYGGAGADLPTVDELYDPSLLGTAP